MNCDFKNELWILFDDVKTKLWIKDLACKFLISSRFWMLKLGRIRNGEEFKEEIVRYIRETFMKMILTSKYLDLSKIDFLLICKPS